MALERANARIAELEARLDQNPQNSSRPPSSQGLDKPAPKSSRKGGQRKPGRPKGQPGVTLEMVAEPKRTKRHEPDRCRGCGDGLADAWCWDNLNIHLAPELADFARDNKEWLRVFQMPSYAPELNPAEGIWSLLKRAMVNFAAADLPGLVRIVKRKLKKIQYRPHLIEGCLAKTGLSIEPW